MFIVIEGRDGSGKTTIAKALVAKLQELGIQAIATREPGGTFAGDRIREILLSTEAGLNDVAELLLFSASRAILVNEVIKPALRNKVVVVCDRWTMSTYAYQSAGRGHDLQFVNELVRRTTFGLTPCATYVLKPTAKQLEERFASKTLDRIEKEAADFQKRVADFYEHNWDQFPNTILVESPVDMDALNVLVEKIIDERGLK